MPNKNSKKLTFPISDTVPGPDTYEAEFIDSDEKGSFPGVKTMKDTKSFGHGTAKDVSSTSQAPRPR